MAMKGIYYMKNFKFIILIIVSAILLTSCSSALLDLVNKKSMTGDRNVLGRSYDMDSDAVYTVIIKDIEIKDFDGMLIFDENSPDSIVITTDENIFLSFDVDVTVENDSHIITVKGDSSLRYTPTTFEIIVGGLVDKIEISGGFKTDMKFASVKNPKIQVSGAIDGNISLNDTESVDIKVAGAVNLNMSGTTEKITANISGAANIKGYELATEIADLNIAGASDIQLTVNDSLSVEMSGASNVSFKGNGEIIKSEINGLGEIKKVTD